MAAAFLTGGGVGAGGFSERDHCLHKSLGIKRRKDEGGKAAAHSTEDGRGLLLDWARWCSSFVVMVSLRTFSASWGAREDENLFPPGNKRNTHTKTRGYFILWCGILEGLRRHPEK